MEKYELPIPIWESPKSEGIVYEKEYTSSFVTVDQLQNKRIQFRPMYQEQQIKGAIPRCYIREELGELLLEVVKRLSANYSLLVYDAWRPYEVQYALYEEYYENYKKEHPYQDEITIREEVKAFVSVPSKDVNIPFVHGTGGAIDLTIIDEQGHELHMGTPFDAFCKESHTAYYEGNDVDLVAKKNRRLLYGIMTEVGFTNLPTEWWHYDYGDYFWAYYTGNKARYKGVLDENGIYTKDEERGR
ncbi:MAG: M15 family metallopeptidase [Eubacteriales bacterium]